MRVKTVKTKMQKAFWVVSFYISIRFFIKEFEKKRLMDRSFILRFSFSFTGQEFPFLIERTAVIER